MQRQFLNPFDVQYVAAPKGARCCTTMEHFGERIAPTSQPSWVPRPCGSQGLSSFFLIIFNYPF
jgi:hypothetical protein